MARSGQSLGFDDTNQCKTKNKKKNNNNKKEKFSQGLEIQKEMRWEEEVERPGLLHCGFERMVSTIRSTWHLTFLRKGHSFTLIN